MIKLFYGKRINSQLSTSAEDWHSCAHAHAHIRSTWTTNVYNFHTINGQCYSSSGRQWTKSTRPALVVVCCRQYFTVIISLSTPVKGSRNDVVRVRGDVEIPRRNNDNYRAYRHVRTGMYVEKYRTSRIGDVLSKIPRARMRPFGFVSGTISGQCTASFVAVHGDRIPPDGEKKYEKNRFSRWKPSVHTRTHSLPLSVSFCVSLSLTRTPRRIYAV